MKNQQAAQAINNANIDLTIRKPSDFKPRKGYKLVHERQINGVAPTADSTHRILGRGYFWTEKGTKELCYVIEVPTNEAEPLNKMFENEKAKYRRAHRCKISNKKHTKKIMCPFTNTCSKCPFAEHPEEIFPSEAEEHQELSFDEVNEDRLSVSADTFGSEKNILQNLEIQEMMNAIRSLDDPSLFKFVFLLRQGYEYDEIMQELGIDINGIKDYYVRYIDYKRKFLDE